VGLALGLGELPKILGFPIIFRQRLKLATSKLARCWGFLRPIIKSHVEEKVNVALCYKSSPKFCGSPLIFLQLLKLATSNLACSWGWPRPTIKTTTRRKTGSGLGLWKLPNIWGSPLIFLQRPRCPLSVIGASCYIRATVKNNSTSGLVDMNTCIPNFHQNNR